MERVLEQMYSLVDETTWALASYSAEATSMVARLFPLVSPSTIFVALDTCLQLRWCSRLCTPCMTNMYGRWPPNLLRHSQGCLTLCWPLLFSLRQFENSDMRGLPLAQRMGFSNGIREQWLLTALR